MFCRLAACSLLGLLCPFLTRPLVRQLAAAFLFGQLLAGRFLRPALVG